MLENVQIARLERFWDRQDRRDRLELLNNTSEDWHECGLLWETEDEHSQQQRVWRVIRSFTLVDKSIPEFAQPFADKVGSLDFTLPPELLESTLCSRCATALTTGMGTLSWPDPSTWCRVCKMIAQLAETLNASRVNDLHIARSDVYFLLLREWLTDCDLNHQNHAQFLFEDPFLPTRVLDVRNKSKLYLHCTKKERGKYVALSHCWGKANTFSTTRENVKDFCNGIELEKLPKTFRDAVEVTQELEIPFLWIDSLCIVQNDRGDWEKESSRMESVFSSAYCTIAATSARDCHQGFLCRSTLQNRGHLAEGHVDSGVDIHVSSARDNFEEDVEKGILNQRGWVYQERALSRRTIHFTSNQTYWECGCVIRSSRLTDWFKDLNWLGDSNFPQTASHLNPGVASSMFEDIFTQYSRLGITVLEDRPIAVQGLESRLAKFYKTQSTYGILERFLHRSLLWQRAGSAPLQPITFKGKGVPSWSWMAYLGAIQYGEQHNWHQHTVLKCNRRVKLDTKNRCITAELAGTLRGFHIEKDTLGLDAMLKDDNDALVGCAKFDVDAECAPASVGCVPIAESDFGWQQFAGVAWDMEFKKSRAGNSDSTGVVSKAASNKKSELWSAEPVCYVLLVDLESVKRKMKKGYRRLGVAVIPKEFLLEDEEQQAIRIV